MQYGGLGVTWRFRTSAVVTLVIVLFVQFFFFQAEDGIRDYKVTGVQTCALPISDLDVPDLRQGARPRLEHQGQEGVRRRDRVGLVRPRLLARELRLDAGVAGGGQEIGRASCRGRV